MNVSYKHILLLTMIFNSSMSMEQTRYIPQKAREIIEQSKPKLDGYLSLEKEEAWYGLMCATWYEDASAVENLLKNRAFDQDVLYEDCLDLQGDRSNFIYYGARETFPRVAVSPFALNKYRKNTKIMKLYKNDESFQTLQFRYNNIKTETKEKLADKMCPLYALAVYLGDLNLLQDCMIRNDFDPEYADRKGGALLQLAVRGGHEDVVDYLLQIPTIQKNINKCGGLAPVMFIAAQRGYCSIAQLLVKVPNIHLEGCYYKNGHCTSALNVAAECKQTKMVKFLREQLLMKNKDLPGITQTLARAYEKEDNPALKELLNSEGMNQNQKNELQQEARKMVKETIENVIKNKYFDNNLREIISFLKKESDGNNGPLMIDIDQLLGLSKK